MRAEPNPAKPRTRPDSADTAAAAMKRRAFTTARMGALSGRSITIGSRHTLCNSPYPQLRLGTAQAAHARMGARCYQRVEMNVTIRILGIDPGLRRTGWGLIDVEGNRLIHVACGSILSNDKVSLAERLVQIHD